MSASIFQIVHPSFAFSGTGGLVDSVGNIGLFANRAAALSLPTEGISICLLAAMLRAKRRIPAANRIKCLTASLADRGLDDFFKHLLLAFKKKYRVFIHPIMKDSTTTITVDGDAKYSLMWGQKRGEPFGQLPLDFRQKRLVSNEASRRSRILTNCPITVKVTPDVMRNKVFGKPVGKFERKRFARMNPSPCERTGKSQRDNVYSYKVKSSFGIPVMVDWLIGPKRLFELLKMCPVFGRKAQAQGGTFCNATIGTNKAKPVSLFRRIDKIEVFRIKFILDWTVGSHGFNVSIWTPRRQVLERGWFGWRKVA